MNNKDESQQDSEEMETENLFKEESENTEDIKEDVNTEEFVDDKNPRQENNSLSETQIRFISEKIAGDWKKLAVKIGIYFFNPYWKMINWFFFVGYKPDEIEYIVQNHSTELEQAENLLLLWFGDDEDATVENLLYILEGLGLNDACDSIKNEFNVS